MRPRFEILKFSIATILLVAFVLTSVSELSMFCDMGACEIAATTKSHHDKSNSDEKGCCSHGEDCCCETLSIPLLADLPKIVVPTPQYKVKSFTDPLYALNSMTANVDQYSGQLTPYQSKPPPKIPDIRVFIQSIII